VDIEHNRQTHSRRHNSKPHHNTAAAKTTQQQDNTGRTCRTRWPRRNEECLRIKSISYQMDELEVLPYLYDNGQDGVT
jgi:hypothetical protein